MVLLFLCGPHGGGKTTLEHKLQELCPDVIVPVLQTATPKFHTTPIERIRLKVCERAIENYELASISEQHSEKITIGNRCIYDADAYADAYLGLGWITSEEHSGLWSLARQAFPFSLHAPHAIVLNPPYRVVEERLAGRWKKGTKKWREDDLAYCREACEAYRQFERVKGVYYTEDNDVNDAMIGFLASLQERSGVIVYNVNDSVFQPARI